MAQSPELPSINSDKRQITPEEAEITRKWYFETSHEGRTGAEFNALREEVRQATVLDFEKLRDDLDYKNLTKENPYVQEFVSDMTVFDLERIYEHRQDVGLSGEQFETLLAIFDKDVQYAFRKAIADGEVVSDLYKKADKYFSPAELKEHSEESLTAMNRETELQQQNLPHEPAKFSFFPRKKRT
jgi:hypothetical protein